MTDVTMFRQKLKDLLQAANQPGGALEGVTIVWPNVPGRGKDLPRIEVDYEVVDMSVTPLTPGAANRETGLFYMNCCTRLGRGEAEALSLAALAAGVFAGLNSIRLPGASLQITSQPMIRGGYHDTTCFRVPVMLRYHGAISVFIRPEQLLWDYRALVWHGANLEWSI